MTGRTCGCITGAVSTTSPTGQTAAARPRGGATGTTAGTVRPAGAPRKASQPSEPQWRVVRVLSRSTRHCRGWIASGCAPACDATRQADAREVGQADADARRRPRRLALRAQVGLLLPLLTYATGPFLG